MVASGTELLSPVIIREARDLNFTNEGGVSGRSPLLKNIAGLWLLQAAGGAGRPRATRLYEFACGGWRRSICVPVAGGSGSRFVPKSGGHAGGY